MSTTDVQILGAPGRRLWAKHRPDDVVAKLGAARAQIAAGGSVCAAAEAIGVSIATFRRWRKEFGGLSLAQVQYVRELQAENNRLRRAILEIEVPADS